MLGSEKCIDESNGYLKELLENILEKFYDKSYMKMVVFSFLSSIWFEYLWLKSSLWKPIDSKDLDASSDIT